MADDFYDDEDDFAPAHQARPFREEQTIQRKKAGFWIGTIVAGAAYLGLAMLAPPLAGWPAITAIEYAVGGFLIACLGGLLGRKLSTSCCMGKDTRDNGYRPLGDIQDIDEESESQKARRNISFTIGALIVGGLAGGLGFAFVLPLFTPGYLVWGAYALGCGFLALCGGKGTEIAMENRRNGSATATLSHAYGGGSTGAIMNNHNLSRRSSRTEEQAAALATPQTDDLPPLEQAVDNDRAFVERQTFSPRRRRAE